MSSTDHSDDLQIERDLPTSEADIVVLRQLRQHSEISFAEALELMSDFDPFLHDIPDRPLAKGWEPFEL
jgi:hypothetical protein